MPVRRIRGVLLFPTALPGGPLRAQVSLRDTGLADASSRILSESIFVIGHFAALEVAFALDLPAAPRRPGARWSFDAVVTRSVDGRVAPGDFVLARAIDYEAGAQPVRLVLEKVT